MTQNSVSSALQTSSRTLGNREKAFAIIICAFGDVAMRVVMEIVDDLVRMLQLLDVRYASNRAVSSVAVMKGLFRRS